MKVDTCVLGAGLDGLAAAALLARAGERVLVVDPADAPGGLAAPFELAPGFVATGPLDPEVRVAPAVERDLGVAVRRSDGRAAVWLAEADGPGLLLDADPARARVALLAGSSRDADAYAAWRAFVARVAPVVHGLWDAPPPPALDAGGPTWALARAALSVRRLGRADLVELLRVLPMAAQDWLTDTFDAPRLRTALAAGAQLGVRGGPRAPGTAGLLLLREASAAPAPVGGAAALVDALVAALRAAGGELRAGTAARRLAVEDGAVRAVELSDGTAVECAAVVAAGAPTALRDLVPPRELPTAVARDLDAWRARGTTAVVLLALDAPPAWSGRPGPVQRVLVASDLDDLERASDAVKYREGSARPVLDVRVLPGGTGGALLQVLAHHAPPAKADADAFGDRVVARLAEHAPDLESRVTARAVLGPADIEARWGALGGHPFQGDLGLDRLLWLRPGPSLSSGATPVRGLFVAGLGVHPGPATLCGSGVQAARARLAAR